jgi:hypothetical protein
MLSETLMGGQEHLNIRIVSLKHRLKREDDVDVEQIMRVRQPLLCLMHRIGIVDIDL